MDRYRSNRFSGGPSPAGASSRRRGLRRVVVIGAIAAVLAAGVAPTSAAAKGPRIGPVRVFASAPAPGHPFGIAVGDGRVYVSTSAGDFFADPATAATNTDDERVFTYDEDGTLLDTTRHRHAPTTRDMGLFGLALDGNPGQSHQLFVADMNGRILAIGLGKHAGPPEVFSQVPASTRASPATGCSRCGTTSCSTRPATSTSPTTSRGSGACRPDGTAHDLVHRPAADRPVRLRRRPARRPDRPDRPVALHLDHPRGRVPARTSTIYRIRLVDHPTAADMQLVHRFAVRPDPPRPPQATGLAFAKSGNLYVSLLGPNQVAVLDPAGNEIRRISDPRFYSPWGLAFIGNTLLVTNGDLEPGDNPAAWKIFKVTSGSRGCR